MVMDHSPVINNNNSLKDAMATASSSSLGGEDVSTTVSSSSSGQPTPMSVGREFVRQYYTLLNRAPLHLHRFYSHNSSFVHGGIDDGHGEPVKGQQAIHQQIMQLNFRECHAKIRQVDAHATLGDGVVVQVSGELSNNGQPMRRFMQTFVLAPQGSKKYFVLNDIFRYQDEVFEENNQAQQNNHVLNNATPNGGSKTDEESHGEEEEVTDEVKERGQVVKQTTPTVSVAKIQREQEQQDVGMASPVSPPDVSDSHSSPSAPTSEDSTGETKAPQLPAEQPEPVKKKEEPVVEANRKEGNKNEKTPVQATPSNETLSYASALVKASGNAAANPTGKPPMSGGPPGTANAGTGPAGSKEGPFGGNKNRGAGTGPGPNPRGSNRNNAGQGPRDRFSSTSGRDEEGQDRRRSGVPPSGSSGNLSNSVNHNGGGVANERANNSAPSTIVPDALQVFVGNLPHNCSEMELERLFSQFGKVVDIRINNKGHLQSKTTPGGQRVPNFGFVVFDDERSVQDCLKKKPIHLPVNEFRQTEHRLNVEEKKNRAGGGGGPGIGSRGNNYNDRGSQEHLVGRGGSANNERSRGYRGGAGAGRPERQGNKGGQGGQGSGSNRKKSPFPSNN